jgi:hypothetical protein
MTMSLTRNKSLSIAASLITLAVYNVVAFVSPFERTSGFWVGYGFSVLASIENEIETKIETLEKSVTLADAASSLALCGELRRLFEERNRQCKLLK